MNPKRKELLPGRGIPLPEEVRRERIRFDLAKQRRWKRWRGVYLVTVALTAALSLTALTLLHGSVSPTFSGGAEREEGVLLPNADSPFSPNDSPTSAPGLTAPQLTPELLYRYDPSAVPDGHTPILPMDLSLGEYGVTYFHNLTGLRPDPETLLCRSFKQNDHLTLLSASSGPRVLIVHTHGTESYSPDGAISCPNGAETLTRSEDTEQNVVAVGRALAEQLNRAGIATVHCDVMHDASQYKDSYARAEETIRRYREQYPSIRLVIDVHRDSILKSTGEIIRPVSLIEGEAAAQMMCVVGSDWGGDENPNWEGNLALALQLRKRLNETYGNLCRPPYLKSSTYNQELAPYSLLLEVGASGNSLKEALRTARAVADALVEIVPNL